MGQFSDSMGYKTTSSVFQISAGVQETAPNTATELTINTNVDSLSREILLIWAVDLDISPCDNVPAADTSVDAYLSNTTQTGAVGIQDPDTIASAASTVKNDGAGGVATFQNAEPRNGPANKEPLYYVATNDLFLGIESTLNVGAKRVQCRIWAQRATIDAASYAALLTAQL